MVRKLAKKKLVVGLLVLVLSLTLFSFVILKPATAQEEVPYGPFPDELIIFYNPDETTVVPQIESGDMHAWLWWLSPETTIAAEQSPKVSLVNAYGLYNEFVVNPLETTEGFNPFSIREVREALNWLIDRNYICNEIWYGRAKPRWTMYKTVSPDYARVADYMKQLESKYTYDFDKAKTQIFGALEKAGAIFKEGKWYYNDEPIIVKLLIRIEDERKPTGDYLASQLEKVGFTVERLYKPYRDAYLLWGALDPAIRGEWHIYTDGWISLAVTEYEDDFAWFMYSEDNKPLFGVYQPSPLLKEAMDRLNNGEYSSIEERNELIKIVTKLSLEDGVHIWYNDQIVSFPYSSDLGPFVYDLYGGSQSFWSLRTFRFKDMVGGTVKLGAMALFVEGFNPAAGFSWLYDVYALYLVSDPGVWPHPHNGRYIPVRENFNVETAGPLGKLPVPSDALTYDVTSGKFVEVGSNVNATSKITFTLTLGQWHHGQPITKADILYGIAEVFKLVTPESDVYDPVAASPARTVFANNFKGIKFISDDVVEVYFDYWHPDETYIASYASIWTDTPWELWVLMNKVVSEKKLAWSIDKADEWGVDMLDLTKGGSLPILKDACDELASLNYIPPELEDIVTPEEASARWSALEEWYNTMGHFWVSNGPYMFDKADVSAMQQSFRAFRNYPFKADVWDDMLTVKVPSVSATNVPAFVVPGLKATFNFTVTALGTPYSEADMKYMILDPAGNLVLIGDSINLGNGLFSVELTGNDTAKLSVGTNTIITITTGHEAAMPIITETPFVVIPALKYFQTQLEGISAELGGRISALEGSLDTMQSELQSLTNSLNSIQNTMNILMGISVVSLIIAIVAVAISLRKPK